MSPALTLSVIAELVWYQHLALLGGVLIAALAVVMVGLLLRRTLRRDWQTWAGETQSQLAEMVQALTELTGQMSEIRAERDNLARDRMAQEKAAVTWKTHHDGVLVKHNELVKKYNGLVGLVKKHTEHQQEIERDKQALEQQSERLTGENEVLGDRVSGLLQQVGDLEQRRDDLHAEIVVLRDRAQDLERRNQQSDLQVADLQQTNATLASELTTQRQTAAGLQQENARLASQRDELSHETQKLGLEAANLQQAYATLAGELTGEREHSALQGQRILELTTWTATLEQAIEEDTAQKDELSRENQKLARQSAGLADELTKEREKALSLEQRAQELTDWTATLEQVIKGHVAKKDELSRENQELVGQAAGLERTNTALAGELTQERRKVLSLEQGTRELTTRNAALKQEVEGLGSQKGELSRENQKLAQEITELRRANTDLHERVAHLERDLEAAKAPALAAPTPVEHVVVEKVLVEKEWLEPDRPIVLDRWFPSRVHLGLDFGTHSTKLIARDRGEEKERLLFFDEPEDGYPSFAAPSLVRLVAGRLFFGRRALRTSGGELYRSLKVDLLPPSESGGWDRGKYSAGITQDLLVACYLSWVLWRTKEALGKSSHAGLTMNVAAPMNHLEDPRLKHRYRLVLNAAWQATFDSDLTPIRQGVELATLLPSFRCLLGKEPAKESETLFQVCPETVAPLVSLFLDPKARPGLYLMADMGAGTTELSVSRVTEHNGVRQIACYFDESTLLGGDQFKENDDSNGSNNKDHSRGEKRLKEQIRDACKKVWHLGFQKDAHGSRALKEEWKRLNIILAGGGFRRAGLREATNAAFPGIPGYPEQWGFVDHHPARLGMVGHPTGFVLDDSRQFLAVAHGLSLEKPKWPDIYYPRDVSPQGPAPRVDQPYDRSSAQSDVGSWSG